MPPPCCTHSFPSHLEKQFTPCNLWHACSGPPPAVQDIQAMGGEWHVNAPVSDIFQAPDRVTVLTHAPDRE